MDKIIVSIGGDMSKADVKKLEALGYTVVTIKPGSDVRVIYSPPGATAPQK